MPFMKGQSGNPKGRPPKSRALTKLLEREGNKRYLAGGVPTQAKRLFAERVWQGLVTGRITFDDGTTITLDASDYIALAKLVLSQVDGPPRAEADVNVRAQDGALVFNIGVTGEGHADVSDGDLE